MAGASSSDARVSSGGSGRFGLRKLREIMAKHTNVIPNGHFKKHGLNYAKHGRCSTPEVLATATQVTEEIKSFNAYAKLRVERTNKRHLGTRLMRAAEAEKEEKK